MQANFINRKFSASSQVNYQLSGLSENEFKNGLARKHFNSFPGNLIYQEYQAPQGQNTSMERLTIHSYDILSRQFSYKGDEFSLNSIVAPTAPRKSCLQSFLSPSPGSRQHLSPFLLPWLRAYCVWRS